MTISATTARNAFVGTGSTGPFAFSFQVNVETDLLVTKRSVSGLETTLVWPADFSVTGVKNAAGGTIILTVALASGETITIRRQPPNTQPMSIRNQGAYFPATIEDEIDRLNMQVIALKDQLDRSFGASETYDPAVLSLRVKPETGKVLTWQSLTQLGNSSLDSSAVALPGGGRTVTTLSAYLLNNQVANVLDFYNVADLNDAPMFQRAADYLAGIGHGGIIRVPSRATSYVFGATTVSIAASGIWLVFDTISTIVTYSGATWAFNFEAPGGLSTINNAGAITASVQCTNVAGSAFRMSRGMNCDFEKCYAESTVSNSTGSGYILDGDSQVFVGTGTVSCAAGAATFSQSQAGVIANDYMIIVAGVYYRVSAFNGTTLCTLGGAPTFGASAFTYITSGHFSTNVVHRHCRSNNFFVAFDWQGGRVGSGYDINTDCAIVDCFGNAGAVTPGTGSIGVRCTSGGSENYVVRGNFEIFDYVARFLTSPGGTVPINNSLDHVRCEAINTKYWTFPAGATPTNSVIMMRGASDPTKIDITGLAVFLSSDAPSLFSKVHRKLPKSVVLANGLNHNIAIGDAEVIIVTGPNAAYSLCGFSRNGISSADSDGRSLRVICLTQSLAITIVENDATDAGTSTAIRTMRDANVTVTRFDGSVFDFMWSNGQGQWILCSNSG